MAIDFKLLIGGKLHDGTGRLDVINPATGKVFARCPRADADLLEAAVASAKAAFPAWAALPWEERASMLRQLANAMEARFEEFATLLTAEQGKPLAQAQFEIGGAIAALRHFSSIDIPVRTLVDNDDDLIIEHRTPLGVVAAITPWNFPVILLVIKVACALISGNTVIAKPAPTTPLTTLLLGMTAAEILPPGVLATLTDANDLGTALTQHADIAKISFTGSTGTGQKVMASAAGTLKRLTLELGGNDAAVLLDDVDVQTVAPQIFAAATINAGQVCMAAKRIYVPRALYDEFCEELGRLASQAVVDDGANQGAQIGPVQNLQQYEKLIDLLADTREKGVVVAGGNALDRPGYFIAPTVVRDLPDDARLVTEEQFGPVIPVLAYDSIDDVIARANDSPFGLAGSIWTSDPLRAVELAKRIDSGTVWINKHLDLRFDVPFGGSKQSGIGREQGMEGVLEFTQAKIINIAKTPATAI